MKLPKIIREYKYVLLLSLLVAFTFRKILIAGGSFGSWDSFGGHTALISFVSENSRSFDIWSDSSFGYVVPIILIKIMGFITIFLGDALFLFNLTILLTMLGAAAGMYFFTFHFTKNHVASFVSAFIFIFNQWIVVKYSVGHLMHIFPYFLLPLLFYVLYKSLDSRNPKYIISFSLILSLFPLMRLDPLYFVFPFVIIFSFTYFIFNIKYLSAAKVSKMALLSALLFILLTLYLFLPIFKVPTMYSSVEYSIEEVLKNSLSFYDTILGQSTIIYSSLFWKAGITWDSHPFLTPSAYKIFMFIILLTALGAMLLRRDFIVICFSLMALVSAFIAKGPQEPFSNVYLWAYDNIPFFSGLHVPNRWLMITWFAYSFLAGITITELTDLIKYRYHWGSKAFSTFLVLIVLFSVFIGSFPVFSQGYETYQFQEQEIEPHKWLMDQMGDFRLTTIPFSQIYAFLEDGTMEQDLGKSSYYFHKKPIINTIFGVSFNSRGSDFPNFIENNVNKREGNSLAKILGIYDVKFFVLQGYPPTVPYSIGRLSYSEHDYFERQIGLVEVFQGNFTPYELKAADYYPPDYIKKNITVKYRTIEIERPAKIFENSYWIPRIFAPQNRMLVAGGTDTFTKLAEIKSFNFSEWNLLFADDLVQKLGKDALKQQIMEADVVAFVNSEPLDMAMYISNSTLIKMKNCKGSWKDDLSPISEGFLVNNRDVLLSDKSGEKTACHIDVKEDDEYEIWVRVFHSSKAGNLKVSIDGKYNSTLLPKSRGTAGFKWVRLNGGFMETGTHTIGLINEASSSGRTNRLNGIVLVKKNEMEKALQKIQELTGSKSAYLFDENILENFDIPAGKVIRYSKNGPGEENNIITNPAKSVKYLEFKELQPSKWKLTVDSTTPYTLVFSNSYHPMWKAYVNGKEYGSFPSYYFINSFQINETGKHEVIIEFTGQRIQNTGLMISGLTYFVCLFYLFCEWKRDLVQRIKNRLKKIHGPHGRNE